MDLQPSPWTAKEFQDVIQAHLIPQLLADDPHAAAWASLACTAWNRACRSARHPRIVANLWGHLDASSLSMWLRAHPNIDALQLTTEVQELCGEDERAAICDLAMHLPER